jgi:predicted O-methyltransferase YrrM
MSWTFEPSFERKASVAALFATLPHREKIDGPGRAGGSPDYYPVLHDVARLIDATSVLEIGVRLGYGAIAILSASPRCERYVGVDNESYIPESNTLALANILHGHAGFNAKIVLDNSAKGLPPEVGKKKFGLAYVDGSKDNIAKDVKNAWDALLVGGSLLIDDVQVETETREQAADGLASIGGQSEIGPIIEVFTGTAEVPRGLLWVTKLRPLSAN